MMDTVANTADISSPVTLSLAGSGAVLLDASSTVFSDVVQEKIWACAASLRAESVVLETVPGMNNLLVTYDPLHETAAYIVDWLRERWESAKGSECEGKIIDVPVRYGGEMGEDLQEVARHLNISPSQLVEKHAAGNYRVAAVGAMPGFPYLSGLDASLHISRRSEPRSVVRKGSVIIGGAQTGIMPTTAPSGWHIIGTTDLTLFDPYRNPACLLHPGDRVRFVAEGTRHD